MSDLVKKLRQYSYQDGETACPGDEIYELVEIIHEAADEIEQLRGALRETYLNIENLDAATFKKIKALGADDG